MDGSNTDLYGSCCLFVSKASLVPGERAPGEYICDNAAPNISPEEVRSTYGLLPNQVCQKLFDHLDRKFDRSFVVIVTIVNCKLTIFSVEVASISRIQLERQSIVLLMRTSNQHDFVRILKVRRSKFSPTIFVPRQSVGVCLEKPRNFSVKNFSPAPTHDSWAIERQVDCSII